MLKGKKITNNRSNSNILRIQNNLSPNQNDSDEILDEENRRDSFPTLSQQRKVIGNTLIEKGAQDLTYEPLH
jgi:hypothetical protein